MCGVQVFVVCERENGYCTCIQVDIVVVYVCVSCNVCFILCFYHNLKPRELKNCLDKYKNKKIYTEWGNYYKSIKNDATPTIERERIIYSFLPPSKERNRERALYYDGLVNKHKFGLSASSTNKQNNKNAISLCVECLNPKWDFYKKIKIEEQDRSREKRKRFIWDHTHICTKS